MKSIGNYGKRLVSLTPVMLLWVAVWSTPTPAFGQGLDTWTCAAGGGNQNWSAPLNWDNGLPTASSDVVITNACPSIVDQPFTIHNLGIMAGGAVTVGINLSLTINGTSVTNDGQLFLNGSTFSSGSADLVIAGSVTLSGNGRLVMSDSPNNLIRGGGSLLNQSTIEGAGSIGSGQLALNNSGIINADSNTFGIVVIPNSSGMPNTGTLESTGSGKLALQGNYGNTGGMIGGTNVVLQGATISGGTLSAGTIRPDFSGATLNGVTLALGCQYVLTNGANTTLNGSITNNGQIKLNAFGTTTTQLVITGTVTVNGNGTITGLGGANNQITGSGTLNIGTQQTLQGGGLLVKVNVLKNQGMIIGNSTTAPLILDCPSGTGVCTSPGLIEAESGGTVQMTCTVSAACTFDDTNGTLSANGGTVTLAGGAVELLSTMGCLLRVEECSISLMAPSTPLLHQPRST